MLPPQPLGDLLWRPIVIKFGGDQARQLRIRGQLAYFRTPLSIRDIQPNLASEGLYRLSVTKPVNSASWADHDVRHV